MQQIILLVIQVIGGAVSVASLFTLCVYAVLACTSGYKSDFLYSLKEAKNLSWTKQIFLIFLVIVIYICMYTGAKTMLWWLPSIDWKRGLAAAFSLICGTLIMSMFCDYYSNKIDKKLSSEKAEKLESILSIISEDNGVNMKLHNIKKEYFNKLNIDFFYGRYLEIKEIKGSYNGYLVHPEVLNRQGQIRMKEIWMYESLINQIERLEKSLTSNSKTLAR